MSVSNMLPLVLLMQLLLQHVNVAAEVDCPTRDIYAQWTTEGGSDPGGECHFPFVYENKCYYNCIKRMSTSYWCATTKFYDKEKFTYCKTVKVDCPSRDTYAQWTTKGGNDPGSKCHFPFIYDNECYYNCTKKNGKKLWCATTKSYDKDGKYTWCNIGENGGSPVSITSAPRSIENLTMGGLILRDCKVSDHVGGNWTYKWTYPDGRTFSSSILYVPNLQGFDFGVYRCIATSDTGRVLETSFNARPVEPPLPMRLNGVDGPLAAGTGHLINCSTEGRHEDLTAITLKFKKGNVMLQWAVSFDVFRMRALDEDGKPRWVTLQVGNRTGDVVIAPQPSDVDGISVRLTPTPGHNGTSVTCSGETNSKKNGSVSRRLAVKWPPAVRSVVFEPEEAEAGTNVTVTCRFDPGSANEQPQIAGLDGWTLERSGPERTERRVSWRRTVGRRDNGAAVTCRVGNSSKTRHLSVRYAPEVTTNFAEPGAAVFVGTTLSCSADANPPANVTIETRPENGPRKDWTAVVSGEGRASGPMPTAEGRTRLRCFARNAVGEKQKEVVVVSVRTVVQPFVTHVLACLAGATAVAVVAAGMVAVVRYRRRKASRGSRATNAGGLAKVAGATNDIASPVSPPSSTGPGFPLTSLGDNPYERQEGGAVNGEYESTPDDYEELDAPYMS